MASGYDRIGAAAPFDVTQVVARGASACAYCSTAVKACSTYIPPSMQPAVFLTVGYFGWSLAIGFFNKWALGSRWRGGAGFTFPFFYSAMHMVCSVVVVSAIFLMRPSLNTLSREQFREHCTSLVVLALLYTVSVGCNNASVDSASLTTKCLITGVTPLLTLALSYAMERKAYASSIVGLVGLQVLCAMLAVPQDGSSTSAYGVLLSMLSVLASAGKPVLSGMLMCERHVTGLTPLALVWYYTAMSSLLMLALTASSTDERTHLAEELRGQPWRSLAAILVGSLLAAGYNILMFYLTLITSALTNTMLGNVKQARLAAHGSRGDAVARRAVGIRSDDIRPLW